VLLVALTILGLVIVTNLSGGGESSIEPSMRQPRKNPHTPAARMADPAVS